MCAGPAAAQYFELLQEQLGNAAVAAHLVAHDMMASILLHVSQHVSAMVRAEYGCNIEALQQTPTQAQNISRATEAMR